MIDGKSLVFISIESLDVTPGRNVVLPFWTGYTSLFGQMFVLVHRCVITHGWVRACFCCVLVCVKHLCAFVLAWVQAYVGAYASCVLGVCTKDI